MIKVNAFNPSATSVAFGSTNNKPVKVKPSMLRAGEELVEQTAKRPSFIRRAYIIGSASLASVLAFVGCGPNNGPITPIDPPAKQITLNDELYPMLRNTYAVSNEEVLAQKINGDTLAIKAISGDMVGVKPLGMEGDSAVYRMSAQDPTVKDFQSVNIVKFFKAKGDGTGVISSRTYTSPRAIFNDPKMKFAGAAKYFTTDNITKIAYDGVEAIKSTPETVGKVINQYQIAWPNELPGKITRLAIK